MIRSKRLALGALFAIVFASVGFFASDSLGTQDPVPVSAATTPAGWIPVHGPQGTRYVNPDHVTHIRQSRESLVIYFDVPQSFITVNSSPDNRRALGIE